MDASCGGAATEAGGDSCDETALLHGLQMRTGAAWPVLLTVSGEHAPHTERPHMRQWCLRMMKENTKPQDLHCVMPLSSIQSGPDGEIFPTALSFPDVVHTRWHIIVTFQARPARPCCLHLA